MDRVSVILPTYNEAQTIVQFVETLEKELKTFNRSYEIVVVDDNSPDGTAQCVRSYAKRHIAVRVMVRYKDRGLGNSIKLGMQRAKGSIVVGMDADFNHRPSTLRAILDGLKHADLVVASRFVSGGGMANATRYYPTLFINLCFKLLGMPIMDNTSGYYAIRKQTLVSLGLDRIYYGYGDYHLRLVAYAHRAGLRIKEVPTYYGERLGGESKSRLWTMAVTYLREVWRLRNA